MRRDPLQEVLSRLEGVKRSGDGYIARCPAHEDRRPSLSITEGEDGRVLLKCHAGCDLDAILAALGLEKRDLFPKDTMRRTLDPGAGIMHLPTRTGRDGKEYPAHPAPIGCTLEALANRCRLSVDYPRSFGASDTTYKGAAAVRIPYRDATGKEAATQYRVALETTEAAGRFKWKKGSKPTLYGWPTLPAARDTGYIVIAEGASDYWTLQYHDIPSLSLPSSTGWKDEYADALEGISDLFVVVEPDQGGQTVREAFSSSRLRERVKFVYMPPDAKDPGELHKKDPESFGHTFQGMLAAAVPASQAATEGSAATDGPFVNWSTFWQRDRSEAEWVYQDVLARGRGHAIYAAHKSMKSLLMLWVAASLATGRDPVAVVYLDYEMGEDDLYERLEDMGYGPGSDLSRLKYALLPTLPPLDTAAGAVALTSLLDDVQREYSEHHLVVIVDTIARAVAGEENSSDTFRGFYSHTGIELKRRALTWVRLDHGGKDPTKGQRGSSGKGDDVDVVWRLTKTENGVSLTRELARMSWIPERVTFGLTEDPLGYRRLAGDWPAGTREAAEALDRLGVPVEVCARVAQRALKDAGEGRRKQVVVAALRWRRERTGEAS